MKKRTVLVLDDAIVKQAKKKAIDEDMSFSALVENLLVGSINNEETKEKPKKGWPSPHIKID